MTPFESSPALPCTVVTLGGTRVLRVDTARMDWKNAAALRYLLTGFEDAPFVLDLTGVDFMDTAALSVILSHARSRSERSPMALAAAGPGVTPLLELLDIGSRMLVVDRPAQAAGLLSARTAA